MYSTPVTSRLPPPPLLYHDNKLPKGTRTGTLKRTVTDTDTNTDTLHTNKTLTVHCGAFQKPFALCVDILLVQHWKCKTSGEMSDKIHRVKLLQSGSLSHRILYCI